MNLPIEILTLFPPSETLLLDRLRPVIDDEMLMVISRADYGMGADEAFEELRPLRDTGVVPTSISFLLYEVLTLTRWSRPDSPNQPRFETAENRYRGHQIRLFAGAVLLRHSAGLQEERDYSDDSTLAACLESARTLGDSINEAFASFLTWQTPQLKFSAQLIFFPLALLILAARLRGARVTDETLGALAEVVLAVDSYDQSRFPEDPRNPQPAAFSVLQGAWKPLGEVLQTIAASITAEDVRTNLELCSTLLDPGY